MGANRYNIPCVDIGTSQRPVLLPPKTCILLPGQVFSGDAGKTSRMQVYRERWRKLLDVIVNRSFSRSKVTLLSGCSHS